MVSFGTSHSDTRKKTLDAIEENIKKAFPEASLYRAWTSKMIRKKVLEQDGLKVFDVMEALDQIVGDGCTDLIVQPTHIMKGVEYDAMIESIEGWKENLSPGSFGSISIGEPVIGNPEDLDVALNAVAKELAPKKDSYLVLMGHGSYHSANQLYEKANERLKDLGLGHIYMATVEGTPTIKEILPRMKKNPLGLNKVTLAPFLMVAGEHAKKDLSGDQEDSWRCIFQREGYEVVCVLRGLGEYQEIRDLLTEHIEEKLGN